MSRDAITKADRPVLRYRLPPFLEMQRTKRGEICWYVRPSRYSSKIRIRETYGTPEFWAKYRDALANNEPNLKKAVSPSVIRRKQSAATREAVLAIVPAEILDAERDCKTWVYFLRAGHRVKIGYSKDPVERAQALRTSLADQAEITFTVKGGRKLEQFFHRVFEGERLQGEWFYYPGKIALFLRGLPPLDKRYEIVI